VGNDSRLDVALFEIRTDKELVVDSALGGRTSYKNAGQTTRQGVEVALDSRWAHNFSSRIAYTYLDARYDEAFVTRIYNPATSSVQNATVAPGRRLPGVAAHSLFGELVWRHPGSGFHAAVEGVARSEVFVEDSNTLQSAPGYVAANLRAGIEKRMGPLRMNGFVRVDNLFDRQYVGSVIVGDTNGRFYEGAPGATGWRG
jgi:iron complex outermembrane receptor protein